MGMRWFYKIYIDIKFIHIFFEKDNFQIVSI